jgi:polysaccharide export outer membrane protein
MSSKNRPLPSNLAWSILALIFHAGCVSGAPYRWVDDLPDIGVPSTEYRIAPRDVIGVRVWNQEAMSLERARVRDDGRISLPFIKDVAVAGLTPNEAAEHLQRELQAVIVSPIVTVTLEEPALLNVSVLGEVANPGAYTVPQPAGVLHALAAAGGLTAYAGLNDIFVLRRLDRASPTPTRIRFRYRDLTSGDKVAAAFLLQSGDVVLVE